MPTLAKKKVFISDLHLGDARSFAEPNPYGRCLKKIPPLLNFLQDLLRSQDVAEVVILGDLFDRWVTPADQDPLISFEEIFAKNSEIITALQQLAEKVILTYVPGNHDMLLPIEKPDEVEQFMKSQIHENLRYEEKYQRGAIVGEHGHHYTLFNAPYPFSDGAPPSLPIGYFISRLEATTKSRTGEDQHFPAILEKSIFETVRQLNFITAFFTKVAEAAQMKESDHIIMNFIPGFPETVEEIGNRYKELITEWQDNRTGIDWPLAVAGDSRLLLLPAAMTYFAPGGSHPDILIFGHTHAYKLLIKYDFKLLDKIPGGLISILDHMMPAWIRDLLPEDKVRNIRKILKESPIIPSDLSFDLPFGISIDHPCRSIYANCGAWVDDVEPCTYVETQEDFKKNRHYVRLHRYYPDKKLMAEAYVNLNT